jgi:hypothetical protein
MQQSDTILNNANNYIQRLDALRNCDSFFMSMTQPQRIAIRNIDLETNLRTGVGECIANPIQPCFPSGACANVVFTPPPCQTLRHRFSNNLTKQK